MRHGRRNLARPSQYYWIMKTMTTTAQSTLQDIASTLPTSDIRSRLSSYAAVDLSYRIRAAVDPDDADRSDVLDRLARGGRG